MITEYKSVINKSLRYIDDNLEKQLSIMDIASHFGYSEFHFSRVFKSEMGITVMEYVTKRKLIKASREIIKGHKVIDAAFQYGWLSHSGFTKAFKQEFGFSPALLKTMIVEIERLGGNTMNHIFMKQTEEHATKEQLFDILKNEAEYMGSEVDLKKLQYIYEFACQAYKGRKRYSGDEYITHPLNVAILLCQMEADENVIYAGLLCDILEKAETSIEMLLKFVPKEAAKIVIQIKEFDTKQMDITENEEVVMVKLAERLHNMRTIEFMEEKKKSVKAKETFDLFMPIARRLGNVKLLEELNDLVLKYV